MSSTKSDYPVTEPVAEPLAVGAEEAARLGSLSESKIWKMMASGELRFVRVGKRRLIPMTELRRILCLNDAAVKADPVANAPAVAHRQRPPVARRTAVGKEKGRRIGGRHDQEF